MYYCENHFASQHCNLVLILLHFFPLPRQAEIHTDFNILYGMMKKHEEFRWMRLRIRRMADAWIQAIKSLAEKQNLEKRKRKKVSLLILFLHVPAFC